MSASTDKKMTREEFRKASPKQYQWLLYNNPQLLKKRYPGVVRVRKWTKEMLLKEAKKYKTRSEFYKGSKGFYEAASRNKWLDDICKHMGCAINGVKKPVLNLDTGEIYESVVYAGRSLGSTKGSNIYQAIKRSGKAGGYRWAYLEDE